MEEEDNPFRDLFPADLDEEWDLTPQIVHTAQDAERSRSVTDEVRCDSQPEPSQVAGTPASDRHHLTRTDKLAFISREVWIPGTVCEEETPTHLSYNVEWRLMVNKKAIARDTEQGVVLHPADCWQLLLQPRLEAALRQNVTAPHRVRPHKTDVVISVTGRSGRPLRKQFEGTEVDWIVVEKQLVAWSDLFRAGRQLRVELSFHHIEVDTSSLSSSVSALRTRNPRNGASATQQMLGELAVQLDAEQESTGQPSIWREEYALMRCDNPSCGLGPHCWPDPVTKKHYRLRTPHLQSLIRHREQTKRPHAREDIPEHIRQQLYIEDEQRLKRKRTDAAASPYNIPPINIHVLPGQSHNQSRSEPPDTSIPGPQGTMLGSARVGLDIPGLRDDAVYAYCDWQQSQVSRAAWKAEFQKACDVVVDRCLDLEQVYDDANADFLIEEGVKAGAARRFVSDIALWVERCKTNGADT